jgi:hypothetical protein
MKAGKELDALIAEKIMGLVKVPYNDPTRFYYLEAESCPTCGYDGKFWDANQNSYEIPPYSTVIASAWEVVEQMHSHAKPVLELFAPQQDYSNEKWRARFSRKWWLDGSGYDHTEEGDTAPEAICKAALAFFDPDYADPRKTLEASP